MSSKSKPLSASDTAAGQPAFSRYIGEQIQQCCPRCGSVTFHLFSAEYDRLGSWIAGNYEIRCECGAVCGEAPLEHLRSTTKYMGNLAMGAAEPLPPAPKGDVPF